MEGIQIMKGKNVLYLSERSVSLSERLSSVNFESKYKFISLENVRDARQ